MKVGDKVGYYSVSFENIDGLVLPDESSVVDMKHYEGIIIEIDDLDHNNLVANVMWTDGFCSWMNIDTLEPLDESR